NCPMDTRAFEIGEALDPPAVETCRALFIEYQRELGVSLCFQGFDRELATLPADYAPPCGRLWLASLQGEPAGCVAIRALTGTDAEMKRLYVRPAYRGKRLGRLLALRAIEAARALGYAMLKLDTLPSMAEAQAMYESLGFVDAERYNDNPVGGVRFMALRLQVP